MTEAPARASCLATVTSDGFAPGTLVLFHSFRRLHPGFGGDFVVIHDGLEEPWMRALEAVAGPIRWVEPGAALRERIDRLIDARPESAPHRREFYSLEAFRLDDYARVLFCDSDLLFRAPVDDLFARPEPLLAAGDGPSYAGEGRDRTTFERLPPEQVDRRDVLRDAFNTGFLAIGAPLLGPEVYDALLDRLDVAAWRSLRIRHTDQWVLNRHFEGRHQRLPAAYNYLLAFHQTIFRRTGMRPSEARVLHYNTRHKPWNAARLPEAVRHAPALLEPWRLWYDAYFDAAGALQRAHLGEAARHAFTAPSPS